jgi:hypothetical protein
MNILLLSADQLPHFESIDGQHRLSPVKLSDGSGFLSADCLTEPHFVAQLTGVVYVETTLAEIDHLLIRDDPNDL